MPHYHVVIILCYPKKKKYDKLFTADEFNNYTTIDEIIWCS